MPNARPRAPVIRLGLRLTLSGGREAVTRLVILAAAVGLGVGLLLVAVAGINAVNAQNDRYAWLWHRRQRSQPAGHAATAGPLWVLITSVDEFGGQTIDRVDVAATGPASPVPPGIPRDPGTGPVLHLPRAGRAAAQRPGGRAGRPLPRPPGGPRSARPRLPSPDSLVIVVGTPPRSWPTAGRRAGDQHRHRSARQQRRREPRACASRPIGRRTTASTSSCRSWRWRCCSRC